MDFRLGPALSAGARFVIDDENYASDEPGGECVADQPAAPTRHTLAALHNAVGNVLADGDEVTLIKELTVRAAGHTLKRGSLIKAIRLPHPDKDRDSQENDCRHDGIKGLVPRAEFVRKR